MKTRTPLLTLVGAGPGDPDLITRKGIKALQDADVVLYDSLVHPDLLLEAPNALKIHVGKRFGQKSTPQGQINDLIVSHAFQYGHVVRLKGGDPMVFARGMEEADFARSFGIEVRVVPGVCTATGLASLAEIPLTYRKVSRGFWVVTATGSEGELTEDLTLAATSSSTVVILMGLHKAREIQACFRAVGKIHTPLAIVSNGSTEKEQRLYGTVNELPELAQQAVSPAILLIGESIAYAKDLSHEKLQELAVAI